MGLPIFECHEASDKIDPGDELEIDSQLGIIKNVTKNQTYKTQAIPPFMQELLDDGGLINHIKKKLFRTKQK